MVVVADVENDSEYHSVSPYHELDEGFFSSNGSRLILHSVCLNVRRCAKGFRIVCTEPDTTSANQGQRQPGTESCVGFLDRCAAFDRSRRASSHLASNSRHLLWGIFVSAPVNE